MPTTIEALPLDAGSRRVLEVDRRVADLQGLVEHGGPGAQRAWTSTPDSTLTCCYAVSDASAISFDSSVAPHVKSSNRVQSPRFFTPVSGVWEGHAGAPRLIKPFGRCDALSRACRSRSTVHLTSRRPLAGGTHHPSAADTSKGYSMIGATRFPTRVLSVLPADWRRTRKNGTPRTSFSTSAP